MSGIVEAVHFSEGDLIRQDAVVAEISPQDYGLRAKKAEENLRGRELALGSARRRLSAEKELLALDATAKQDLITAMSEVEIASQKLAEAKLDLEMARLKVAACTVRAPFTGYLVELHRRQYEPVERLQKLFTIMDASRVYAVANVPERLVGRFRPGGRAVFSGASGARFVGKVERIANLVDARSATTKVYVLIDNADGELKVGSAGAVEPVE